MNKMQWGLNELISMKYFTEYLARNKLSINVRDFSIVSYVKIELIYIPNSTVKEIGFPKSLPILPNFPFCILSMNRLFVFFDSFPTGFLMLLNF